MTPEDLKEIENEAARLEAVSQSPRLRILLDRDIPKLITEIRRLQQELERRNCQFCRSTNSFCELHEKDIINRIEPMDYPRL